VDVPHDGRVDRTSRRIRNGDEILVTNEVQPPQGDSYQLDNRFSYDATRQMWHVETGIGTPIGVDGYAPPWTERDWQVMGRDSTGHSVLVGYTLLASGEIRQTFARRPCQRALVADEQRTLQRR
jgi:hypothetical protein